MHRFRCDGLAALEPGAELELERSESSHLFKTLRAEPGCEVGLMDGRGGLGVAKVAPGRRLELVSKSQAQEPFRKLRLCIAPPRRQKTDQILRQCAELGVWSIVPMICRRSVSVPGEDSVAGRWEDVLFEACKQSGNPFLPSLCAPQRFEAVVEESASSCHACLYGAVEGEGAALSLPAEGSFAWFIGPEGGFAPEELELFALKGFKPLRLGGWTLRVETAAICGAALILAR